MLPLGARQGAPATPQGAFGRRPFFSPPTTDHAEIAPVYGEFVEAPCFSGEMLNAPGTKS
jgi:hypothetical protein